MPISPWNIIVVEDTFDDQQVISHILRHYGNEVHIAKNGDECLKLLETIEPTVIIMDLAMPQRDGWQTLVAIRASIHTAHLPVVAMTAYHSAEVAERALQAGFDYYFAKPVHPETFIRRLAEILIAE